MTSITRIRVSNFQHPNALLLLLPFLSVSSEPSRESVIQKNDSPRTDQQAKTEAELKAIEAKIQKELM